jgi:hypothetical protein
MPGAERPKNRATPTELMTADARRITPTLDWDDAGPAVCARVGKVRVAGGVRAGLC